MVKIVTFSFDDGNKHDINIANILNRYGVKATFYITTNKIACGDLTKDYIDALKPHEIASHLFDHVDMSSLSGDELEYQLYKSKEILDSINDNNDVNMLSYPWGAYNMSDIDVIKSHNYIGGRTTNEIGIHSISDITPFEMPISYFLEHQSLSSVKSAMLNLLKTDGILHFCGHSWKFDDDYDEKSDIYDYKEFENFISLIANMPGVLYLSNGEIIKIRRENYWDRIAYTYRKQYWSSESGYINEIVNRCKLDSSFSVLDAGTGHGIISNAMSPIVNKVNAVDISGEMISNAISDNDGKNNIFYSVSDLNELNFEDNTFDRIVLRLVLHHLVDTYDSVLSELHRVLKPGGIVLISEGVPPNEHVIKRYEEIFYLKEDRITFRDGQIELMMAPYFEDIETTEYIMHDVSTRSWLENSDMSGEKVNKILQLHIDSDDIFKKSYNMIIKNEPLDAIVDWKFLILTGTKKM